MRNLDKYKGVIPAFYACYDKEGNISPEAPSERYRLIQFSMVEWPNLASRAASRIRSRPARYSSTSETFSSDASSFRFLICALSAVISLSVLLGAYQSVPQLFAIF